jgi:hypothetical protein
MRRHSKRSCIADHWCAIYQANVESICAAFSLIISTDILDARPPEEWYGDSHVPWRELATEKPPGKIMPYEGSRDCSLPVRQEPATPASGGIQSGPDRASA